MRAGGAEGDPERDGRRPLVNGWESRLWRLEDKRLREGSSVRQFGRPRPLRICHRRRRLNKAFVLSTIDNYTSIAISAAITALLAATIMIQLL